METLTLKHKAAPGVCEISLHSRAKYRESEHQRFDFQRSGINKPPIAAAGEALLEMPGAAGESRCSEDPSCGAGQGSRGVPAGRQGCRRCSQAMPAAAWGWCKRSLGVYFCRFFPSPSAAELRHPQMPVRKAQTRAQNKESSVGAAGGKGPIAAAPIPLFAFCLT